MESRFITTDVHGHFKTFETLCKKVLNETALGEVEFYSKLTIAGDLIDRGSEGRSMVNFCIENNIDVVMGNHEKMLIDFASARNSGGPDYLKNGGKCYIAEFGCSDEETSEMEKQIEWMKSLPYLIAYPDITKDGRTLVVSHSWLSDINYRESLKDDQKTKLIWNRPYSENGGMPFEEKSVKDIPGVFNVFGHCYLQAPEISDYHANLDGGVFVSSWAKESNVGPKPGLDKLHMLQFPQMKLWSQKTISNESN